MQKSAYEDHKLSDPTFAVIEKKEGSVIEIPNEGHLKKSFSIWSVLGVGFGLTNSWISISASLITGIQSGGPMLIVYGILILAFISYGIGITLSELSSAIPSAGGQYVWTRVLAPKKYSGLLSYLCGSLSWVGSMFTSASVTLSISMSTMGLWNLMHPGHETKSWHLFIVYQLVNLALVGFNCYGRLLPIFASGALYLSLISYIVITITVLACAKGNYNSADFVFVIFENETGWKSSAIAFIVGLINPSWGFACLDAATHLAEEVHNPERIIPIAIMGTVSIGLVTSLTYAIAMFFSIRDLNALINSGTGFPILDIFHQALSNRIGAVCLGTMILVSTFGAGIASHTWQARLCWSFSRDNGLPFSKYLSTVDPRLDVPLNAHLTSSAIVAILGCLYLVSTTAFNSMIVGCITFLLLSYMVPTICLLYRGRDNIKHGCFWLGKLGLAANVMTIAWSLFALCFFSFPSFMPVNAGSMNYICVFYLIYAVLALGYWYFPLKSLSCRVKFAGETDDKFQEKEEDFSHVCLTHL